MYYTYTMYIIHIYYTYTIYIYIMFTGWGRDYSIVWIREQDQ